MSPAVRAMLPAALAFVRSELEPAPIDQLVIGLTAFSGLVGQDWTASGREEFIDLASQELEALPGAMVLDALARARRRVNNGRILVSWICDDVEPRAAKLCGELEIIQRLTDLAG